MPTRSTIRLPQELEEQIRGSNDGSARRKKPSGRQLSRKETRKQDRQERKNRKADYFSSRAHPEKRHAEDVDYADAPKRKKTKLAPADDLRVVHDGSRPPKKPTEESGHRNDTKVPSKSKNKKSTKTKSSTALEKLAARSGSVSKKSKSLPRTQAEIEEDAYISYLENQLSGKKGNKKTGDLSAELADDGLDDLLSDLNAFDSRATHEADASSNSDAEEEDDDHAEDTDSGSFHGFGDPADEVESSHEESVSETSVPVSAPAPSPAPQIAQPTAGGRYIPPHLRKSTESKEDSEALAKLKRSLKGLLNRLTEQNIGTILDDVEEMYRKRRRHDVTSTLTDLIIEGTASHSILLDSYVVLHAAFVSSLHRIVGIEFAAYFVQTVASSYERYYPAVQQDSEDTPEGPDSEPKGKECSNLIVLLSELYNFQVVSCVLIYDLIRGLLDGELSEFNVELLLKITRNSGHQLRQDDPSALKDIVQSVHTKVSGKSEGLSSRTRFMLETLTNLKNNKVKRNTAPGANDAVERMKKFLSGLNKKRHVRAYEPLRVTLEDLRSAETKGQWWLVGAAWGGNPLVDRLENARQEQTNAVQTENALLKLARKQGMNTDIRRTIFVVLMSSDDYADAYEKLSQLNLTEIQQREIVRVILGCLGNEKSYNPFYTLVCQRLCQSSHSYKVTLQFCLWDFLRDLGETGVGGAEVIKSARENDDFDSKGISNTRLRNAAKAYAWWVAKDATNLLILKPVDFTALKPRTRDFFKEFFKYLFISTQSTNPVLSDVPTSRNRGILEQVFIKATRIETLALGLIYFLSEAYKKGDDEEAGEQRFMKWGLEVARDTLRTGLDIVPNL